MSDISPIYKFKYVGSNETELHMPLTVLSNPDNDGNRNPVDLRNFVAGVVYETNHYKSAVRVAKSADFELVEDAPAKPERSAAQSRTKVHSTADDADNSPDNTTGDKD